MGGPMMGGMMGGMPGMGDEEKPFYQLESDSIVQACLFDLPFILDSKKTEKFSKLIKTEYEEACRAIQMTVIEYMVTNQLAANGGGMPGMGMMGGPMMMMEVEAQELDQDAIRKNVEQITAKYAKKYKKQLDSDQLAEWNKIQDARYGKGLGYLIAHVYDNTSIDF